MCQGRMHTPCHRKEESEGGEDGAWLWGKMWRKAGGLLPGSPQSWTQYISSLAVPGSFESSFFSPNRPGSVPTWPHPSSCAGCPQQLHGRGDRCAPDPARGRGTPHRTRAVGDSNQYDWGHLIERLLHACLGPGSRDRAANKIDTFCPQGACTLVGETK